MILGISSFTYGWSVGVQDSMPAKPMDEVELVSKAIEFDVSLLQIGDNLPLHGFSEERLKNFRSILEEKNITLEVGARKLTAKNIERYVEISKFFNAKLLRFIIDGDAYEPSPQDVVKVVSDFLPEFKKNNITLGIENHDRFKARELANIIEACGSNHVGICLDCVNSMGAGEGLEEVAETLAPYTVNLHIKDFTVQRLSHKMGFTINGIPAGKGMTNIPRLIDKLNPYNRCNTAVLEQWVTPEENIKDTVFKENQWAEESMQYLATLPYFKGE